MLSKIYEEDAFGLAVICDTNSLRARARVMGLLPRGKELRVCQ